MTQALAAFGGSGGNAQRASKPFVVPYVFSLDDVSPVASLPSEGVYARGKRVAGDSFTAGKDFPATAGGSVASRYTLQGEGLSLSFLNSVSSLSTLPFEYGGRQVDYGLSNIALRNGVAAERPLSAPDGIRPLHLLGIELSETRFTGDDLYIEQSWEAAVTWRRVEPGLGEVAAARLSALATDAGDTGARLSLDLAF